MLVMGDSLFAAFKDRTISNTFEALQILQVRARRKEKEVHT
jgi:hypothetical protein